MSKYFYSHIVETSTISLELGEMDLSKEERLHLISLAQANIHSAVLDIILSHLSDDGKKIFLDNLTSKDHVKLWKHLKENIDDIEEKIKKVADDLKKELFKDIQEARINAKARQSKEKVISSNK